MAGRKWLETDIDEIYLPRLRSLDDDRAGQAEAERLFTSMRAAWSARNLITVEQQYSCLAEVRSRIKAELGSDHWTLSFIAFSKAEHVEINNERQQRVGDRNLAVQFIDDPEEIVAKAVRLLESPEWSEVAAGLSVVTGRRLTELLATATFTPKSKWSVVFSGALKRRGEPVELSFEIPTLTTAEKVCRALEALRLALPETGDLTPQAVNRSYGQAVSRACDEHFSGLIPLRGDRDTLYTHISRSIYATIAVFWYCPQSVDATEFKAAIQGHFQILDEENPELRRSLVASRHYSDYEIADSVIAKYHGKRKGIKLGLGGVEVIQSFRQAEASTPSAATREHRASVRLYHRDKALLEAIFDRLGLDSQGTQQDRMRSFLTWADEQLKAPSSSPPDPSLPLAPVQVAASDVDQRLNKLVDAVSLLVQSQLHQKQVESASGPVAKRERVPSHEEVPSQATAAASTEQKTSRQVNTDKLNGAIDAIIAWNNAPLRKHDDKWAITINALKSFVNSQPKIMSILSNRADEIQAHHEEHQIDPAKHNLRHRGKANISEIISVSP